MQFTIYGLPDDLADVLEEQFGRVDSESDDELIARFFREQLRDLMLQHRQGGVEDEVETELGTISHTNGG